MSLKKIFYIEILLLWLQLLWGVSLCLDDEDDDDDDGYDGGGFNSQVTGKWLKVFVFRLSVLFFIFHILSIFYQESNFI